MNNKQLIVRPCTVKGAIKWVKLTHRRLPNLQGAMWAVSVNRGLEEEMVGVAAVGHAARKFAEQSILCVLRVSVIEGNKNACSMLYGACSRAAKAMGASGLVTYTHLDELGTSLAASNWVPDGTTRGGEHSRVSRPRPPAVDASPKIRWWAPWSKCLHEQ